MTNWKPINTAPKDRMILLAYIDGEVESGRFYDEINGFICGSMLRSPSESFKAYQHIAWQELPVFDGVIAE